MIISVASAFAGPGNQTLVNLRHLEPDQQVGQWRDSTYGIGGGRIPFDVNTALVPAALYAISNLSAGGLLDGNDADLSRRILDFAQVWESETLQFFSIIEDVSDAQQLVADYATSSSFPGPADVSTIVQPVNYYALALDGNDDQSKVKVVSRRLCYATNTLCADALSR